MRWLEAPSAFERDNGEPSQVDFAPLIHSVVAAFECRATRPSGRRRAKHGGNDVGT